MAELKEQTIEKEFVSYEIALELKELGFEEPCFGSIDQIGCIHVKGSKSSPRGSMMYNTIDCPTFSQAFRFFREKYNFVSEINVYSTSDGYSYTFKILCKKYTPYKEANNAWVTYEEAEFECLVKLIEIAKGQNVK